MAGLIYYLHIISILMGVLLDKDSHTTHSILYAIDQVKIHQLLTGWLPELQTLEDVDVHMYH